MPSNHLLQAHIWNVLWRIFCLVNIGVSGIVDAKSKSICSNTEGRRCINIRVDWMGIFWSDSYSKCFFNYLRKLFAGNIPWRL